MNADPLRPLPSEEQYRADLAAWPDMAQMPEPEPRRIDWLNVAAWGAVVVLGVAFWAMVTTGLVRWWLS